MCMLAAALGAQTLLGLKASRDARKAQDEANARIEAEQAAAAKAAADERRRGSLRMADADRDRERLTRRNFALQLFSDEGGSDPSQPPTLGV